LDVAGRGTLIIASGRRGEVFEDMSGVEKFGINVLGSKEVTTDDENFGGDVTVERR